MRVWRLGSDELQFSTITRGDDWCVWISISSTLLPFVSILKLNIRSALAFDLQLGLKLLCVHASGPHARLQVKIPRFEFSFETTVFCVLLAYRTPEWSSDESLYGRMVSNEVQFFNPSDFAKGAVAKLYMKDVSKCAVSPGPVVSVAIFVPSKKVCRASRERTYTWMRTHDVNSVVFSSSLE